MNLNPLDFQGLRTPSVIIFHSGRWNYDVSGGDATGDLKNPSDKTVGVDWNWTFWDSTHTQVGSTCEETLPIPTNPVLGLQLVRVLPSIPPSVYRWNEVGKQTAIMKDLAEILQGDGLNKECTTLEGLKALTIKAIFKEAEISRLRPQPSEILKLLQLVDFQLMESIRKLVEDTV